MKGVGGSEPQNFSIFHGYAVLVRSHSKALLTRKYWRIPMQGRRPRAIAGCSQKEEQDISSKSYEPLSNLVEMSDNSKTGQHSINTSKCEDLPENL
ncbi:hypothetical protein JTB14_017924 [Gonioctena quinquepunctata]|nr:hypothetical protein JTB14_017924 [Gonioctena quinquepunctata]